MKTGMICQRLVFTVGRADEVSRAAQLMREHHIGFLVVVERDSVAGFPRPVGVLTDRDIVVTVVARGVDPKTVVVGDIMSSQPVTVLESESLGSTLEKMRESGVRRVPVVNDRGELIGVLSTDDILELIADDTSELVAAIRNERRIERTARP